MSNVYNIIVFFAPNPSHGHLLQRETDEEPHAHLDQHSSSASTRCTCKSWQMPLLSSLRSGSREGVASLFVVVLFFMEFFVQDHSLFQQMDDVVLSLAVLLKMQDALILQLQDS